MHNMSPARLLCLVLTLAACRATGAADKQSGIFYPRSLRGGKEEKKEKDRHFVLFPLGQGGQNQPILHLFRRAVGRFPIYRVVAMRGEGFVIPLVHCSPPGDGARHVVT